MNTGPSILDDAPDHVCHIDCKLITREDGGRSHIMYASTPNTAAGRYQYDGNREILNMGRGARKAMRATGQDDTRTNREWSYARKLFKDAAGLAKTSTEPLAQIDAEYRDKVNAVFGPDRRPYVKRSIRSMARVRSGMDIRKGLDWEIYKHSRPAYLAGSEHDPNL